MRKVSYIKIIIELFDNCRIVIKNHINSIIGSFAENEILYMGTSVSGRKEGALLKE